MKTDKTGGYPGALGAIARLFPNLELAVTFVTFWAGVVGDKYLSRRDYRPIQSSQPDANQLDYFSFPTVRVAIINESRSTSPLTPQS